MLKKLKRAHKISQTSENLNVPPGQYVTEKFPILTFGSVPKVDINNWHLRFFGIGVKEVTMNWNELMNLQKITVTSPFHCVTQWSRLKNKWTGVPFAEIVKYVGLKSEARYVMVHCFGGYTTNLSLDVLLMDDVLLAYELDGQLLSSEHGGPMRLVVPSRYGWKSAKWVNGLEFMSKDYPGFWEQRGYNMRGDPLKEERFSDS